MSAVRVMTSPSRSAARRRCIRHLHGLIPFRTLAVISSEANFLRHGVPSRRTRCAHGLGAVREPVAPRSRMAAIRSAAASVIVNVLPRAHR